MKKQALIATLLATAFTFTLTGCKNNQDNSNGDENNPAITATQDTTPEATTEAASQPATEQPAADATAPAADDAQGTDNSENPAA